VLSRTPAPLGLCHGQQYRGGSVEFGIPAKSVLIVNPRSGGATQNSLPSESAIVIQVCGSAED